MNEFLNDAVNVIVLIAGVCVALTNISRFLKRPTDAVKSKAEEAQKKHDDELTESITESVMDQVEPLINDIRDINLAQSASIRLLTNGQLDLLRQQILYLYEHHQTSQTLTHEEMEQLHKLYNDYTAAGGNSFVQSLYEQMRTWQIQN